MRGDYIVWPGYVEKRGRGVSLVHPHFSKHGIITIWHFYTVLLSLSACVRMYGVGSRFFLLLFTHSPVHFVYYYIAAAAQ